jgi:antitoxin component of MazEF toxin-antitoxin module
MQTRVREWEENLVLAIPSVLAESMGIRRDSVVEVAVESGRLVVSPAVAYNYDDSVRPIWETALELAAAIPDDELDKVPADGSINVKHYLYGAPRRS